MIRHLIVTLWFLATAVPNASSAQLPADLKEAMVARDKAAAAKDAVTWDRLTSEEFTVVLEDGVLRTKAERLAHLKSQRPGVWTPPQQENVSVYGDVAVQRFLSGGTWAIVVWRREAHGWKVVAAQDTPAKK